MTHIPTIAYDCHAHVYETVVAVTRPRYLPRHPAPLGAWRALLAAHGVKGGVLVQPSFLGTDNTQMLAAIAQLPEGQFAGVAVVPLSIMPTELERLLSLGVRGLRWNFVEGAQLPDPDTPEIRRFLTRVADTGLHMELHLEGPRLAGFLPQLVPHCARLVIDHYGLPAATDPFADPGFRAITGAARNGQLWVKLSAAYRSKASSGHLRALAESIGPGRLVWGSDWPWTRHEAGRDYGKLLADPALSALDPGQMNAAAQELYGLR